MEVWREVWRRGIAPYLSVRGLECLRQALRRDDYRLIQGATTSPPPLQCVRDWPAEAACALGYCGWQGEGLFTVGEVEEYFARMCFLANKALKEPAVVRYFLNWFDDTPRDEMRRNLLVEVNLELSRLRLLRGQALVKLVVGKRAEGIAPSKHCSTAATPPKPDCLLARNLSGRQP